MKLPLLRSSLFLFTLSVAACVDDPDALDAPEEPDVIHAGPVEDLDMRWPNGVVRFRIDPSVNGVNEGRILDAHADLTARTPLRFVDVGPDPDGDFVTYLQVPGNGSAAADGSGMQGGEQEVELRGDVAFTTIRHEIGHVVGLRHEQKRPDAAAFIHIRFECIDDDFQYEAADNVDPIGPYDFTSFMHYATGQSCEDPRPAGCTHAATNRCDTMHKWVDGAAIVPDGKLSRFDLAALWRMYNEPLDTEQAGDQFGKAIAVGDFNGDELDDVAVGAPGETSGTGLVLVFRGTTGGMVPWQKLRQSQAFGTNEPGDEFGAALAAGDIDGDGIDDLVIGAPGEDLQAPGVNYLDTGAVTSFKGSASGLTGWRLYTQSTNSVSQDQTGDRFGTSVAIAALAGPPPSGINGWERAVLIGAPFELNDTRVGPVRAGAVFVFDQHKDPSMFFSWTARKLTGSAAANAKFGAAIGVGNLDDADDNDDLVIGAPGHAGTGAAWGFAGQDPSGSISNPANAVFRSMIGGPAGAIEFGAAITTGSLRGSLTGRDEIAIGAPASASASGRVFVYEPWGPSLAEGSILLRQTLSQNGNVEAGDRFGAAVLIANVDEATEQADLLIGAPGEDTGAGVVSLFRGNVGDCTAQSILRSHQAFPGVEEPGDGFGTALGSGDVDGIEEFLTSDAWGDDTARFLDLVVGQPGEAPDHFFPPQGPAGAGAFSVFEGEVAGPVGRVQYSEAAGVQE